MFRSLSSPRALLSIGTESADIDACNGVVHLVNNVLLPNL